MEERDPTTAEDHQPNERHSKSEEEVQAAGNLAEDADSGKLNSNQSVSIKASENGQETEEKQKDNEEAGSKDNKNSTVEEEVAALLQNLANEPSESNGNKRTRRSARERKSSLYSDYETEFKGNWDQAAYAPRKKNQVTSAKRESAKDSYVDFNQNMGKKITENSKRLLDLLQSSAKQTRPSQHMPLMAPTPAWKPSRLSIAKFIESSVYGADIIRPRDFETSFSQIPPGNNYGGLPGMNGGNESVETARLMSLLSSLTNQPGGMMDNRQQAMNMFSQGITGAMQQQVNPAMLQSFLNANLHNQPPQRMQYPTYPGGMHAPPYHH